MSLALVAFASGCGGQTGPSPVDRNEIMTAFSRIGEPLKIRADLQPTLDAAGPDSSASTVDVIYISASADVSKAPFQVSLFDDEEAARKRALWMESATGGMIDIVRRKNVILNLSPPISDARRDKLIRTLAAL